MYTTACYLLDFYLLFAAFYLFTVSFLLFIVCLRMVKKRHFIVWQFCRWKSLDKFLNLFYEDLIVYRDEWDITVRFSAKISIASS